MDQSDWNLYPSEVIAPPAFLPRGGGDWMQTGPDGRLLIPVHVFGQWEVQNRRGPASVVAWFSPETAAQMVFAIESHSGRMMRDEEVLGHLQRIRQDGGIGVASRSHRPPELPSGFTVAPGGGPLPTRTPQPYRTPTR